MDMETTAWMSMFHASNATQERRSFSRATLKRIASFATPHKRLLTLFLVMSVLGALLAVATPVLAGRVVDAIVAGKAAGTSSGWRS